MARRHRTLPRSRVIAAVVTTVAVLVAAVGAYGTFVLMRTPNDPVKKADAVVVLGGEHDGREDFGVKLATKLHASTVVLSNPYGPKDKVMKRLCDTIQGDVQVICEKPEPSTTRGEAMFTDRLAAEHHWRRIVVISWRYHLIRARFIFDQCAAGSGASFAFVAVPRRYPQTVAQFSYIFAYQVGGTLKALIQGECGR